MKKTEVWFIRGGSWISDPVTLNTVFRNGRPPRSSRVDIGVRLTVPFFNPAPPDRKGEV